MLRVVWQNKIAAFESSPMWLHAILPDDCTLANNHTIMGMVSKEQRATILSYYLPIF